MMLGINGEDGEDEQRFDKPTDVEVGPYGSIYVTDGYGNNRAVRFDKDGNYDFAWETKGTADGEFDTSHGIAVDGDVRVYVADRRDARVQVFDLGGAFLAKWKSDEIRRLWGVDITPDGTVLVADGGDRNNTAYGRNGALEMTTHGDTVERWGSYGSYDGHLLPGARYCSRPGRSRMRRGRQRRNAGAEVRPTIEKPVEPGPCAAESRPPTCLSAIRAAVSTAALIGPGLW